MQIIVATDGSLDPADTASVVKPLAGDSPVTVVTAVEIPRRLLSELRAVFGERRGPSVDSDAEYVGLSPEQPNVGSDFPGEDAIIERYLQNQLDERTSGMRSALTDAGLDVTVDILDGENEAQLILDYLRSRKADLVVLGTKGRGLFEGMLGSTGTKVARLAPCSVLLIRV